VTKSYHVVETFATWQGEGRWSGRRAVFVRLAGCNMWDGYPEHRAQGAGACARWCDTRFTDGQKTTTQEIVDRAAISWGGFPYSMTAESTRMVVISGGEPCLQLEEELVNLFHRNGWFVSVETNGTIDNPALKLCDHVCVSPKRGSTLRVMQASELKVVLPGCVAGAPPEHRWTDGELRDLAVLGLWAQKFVQPQDFTDEDHVEQTYLHAIRIGAKPNEVAIAGVIYEAHVQECLRFLKDNPGWRLSLQTHKYIGLK